MTNEIAPNQNHCLYCGYDLQSLTLGHVCPECGHLPDLQAERQKVLNLINRPMLRLGWRMLLFWKPLPAGFWWVLDQPSDRSAARRRIWTWRGLFLITALVLTVIMSAVRRDHRTTVYQHPPGEPEKKEVLIHRSMPPGNPSAATSTAASLAKPGWVVTAEPTDRFGVRLSFNVIAAAITYTALLTWFAWLMMRWVWLPICLVTSPRAKNKAKRRAIGAAALYHHAPFFLLLYAQAAALLMWWFLYTIRVSNLDVMQGVYIAFLLNLVFTGLIWISAIRSDRTGHLFENKMLPILGILLAAGPGTLLPLFVVYLLLAAAWALFG